jgi:hypothetical protein
MVALLEDCDDHNAAVPLVSRSTPDVQVGRRVTYEDVAQA